MHSENKSIHTPGSRLSPALALYPLAHLAVEVYNSILSIMWPLLTARFGLTYSAVGLLTMLFRGSMTLPQLAFAPLSDRHGSRRPAVCGLVWMAVGMSLVGLAPNVGALALILALAPLGSAAFHPAGTAHMSRAFSRGRGLAVAMFMIGGTIGMSLGPVLGAWLFDRYGPAASPWLLPLGLVVAGSMLLLIPVDGSAAQRPAEDGKPKARILPVLFLLVGASVSMAWIENSLSSYLTLLITGRGLDLAVASRTLFAFSASMAGGVLAGGVLSDRIPRWQVIVLAQALSTPLYAWTVLLGGQGALLVPAGLGFASALSHPVTVALAQELMPERASLAAALTMGFSWVIGSLGAALTGVLADHIGMQPALLSNSALPVIGIACTLAVYRLTRGPAAGPAAPTLAH